MRVLIIDVASNALDFAMRCQDWGHDVMFYDAPHKDGSVRMAGKGIVPRLIDYNLLQTKYLDWSDLIFLPDNVKYLDMLEPKRKAGYPIFGCCLEAAELELDRAKGQEAMKAAGLSIIPGVEFHDYDDAAKFVEKNPQYLVSKPSGDGDRALSFVADDAASLQHMMLDRWKKNDKYRSEARKHGFILQEKKTGVEFACGGWFGPGGWSKFWYQNAEYKKFLAGDMGPNTGEMGTLSMYVRECKLADLALKPMAKMLKKMEYIGFLDISGMVDDEGTFWPFELTCRPGWPSFHNQMATHEGDPAKWMLDLLTGNDTLEVKENIACVSVVMATGDFPNSHLTLKEVTGIPIYNATDREHVHLCDVMLGDDVPVQVGEKTVRMPNYVTSGEYVMVMTGTGTTITGARRSAYAALNKVKLPMHKICRPDIGAGRMVKGLPALQKHGFAKNFKFL